MVLDVPVWDHLAALDELRARGVEAVGVDAVAVGAGATGRNGGLVLAGLAKFYHHTVAQLISACCVDTPRSMELRACVE